MKKVTMVTGNMGKWQVASNIFSKYNVELDHFKMETPEIQDYNVEEVSKYSAEYAAKELNTAVIKSDVGYFIPALGGFPGPFLKYINGMLKVEDILEMMKDKTDRTILLKECLTFACPGKETKQFIFTESATIALKAEGEGSSFDRILIFKGQNHPKSLNTPEENTRHFEETLSLYDEMAKYIEEV